MATRGVEEGKRWRDNVYLIATEAERSWILALAHSRGSVAKL